jgi:hypothetical protein
MIIAIGEVSRAESAAARFTVSINAAQGTAMLKVKPVRPQNAMNTSPFRQFD